MRQAHQLMSPAAAPYASRRRELTSSPITCVAPFHSPSGREQASFGRSTPGSYPRNNQFGAYKRFWDSDAKRGLKSEHSTIAETPDTINLQNITGTLNSCTPVQKLARLRNTPQRLVMGTPDTPRTNRLNAFVQKLKLEKYLPSMKSQLGVALFSDLLILTPEEVSTLGMRTLEAS